MIDEKVYAIPQQLWLQVHRSLLQAGFAFLGPVNAGEGCLEGYWQAAPGRGPVLTVWLRPLTHHDMRLAASMCGAADQGLVGGPANCANFARFYLHFKPFSDDIWFPPVDVATAELIWNRVQAAVSPYGRYIAGTESKRPSFPWSSSGPYRYNVGPGK